MNEITQIGVVVIGRNEGERLKTCLDALDVKSVKLVYVDSDSDDGSIHEATIRDALVVELDSSKPLNAARARNTGFEFLATKYPDLKFVQFIDGDCELNQDWLSKAHEFLEGHSEVAAVCGRITERYPKNSVYNFLCQSEWDTPAGKSKSCGGNTLIRVSALISEGGFRDDLIAGEEPELCFRLRRAGWEIWKLPDEMVIHDANMMHFSEWWKRAIRGGYAFAQGMCIHGATSELFNVKESLRIWFWGVAIPALIIVWVILAGPAGFLLLAIYPLQVFRLVLKAGGVSKRNIITSFFLVLKKFPEMFGQFKYCVNRLLKTRTRLIEYK